MCREGIVIAVAPVIAGVDADVLQRVFVAQEVRLRQGIQVQEVVRVVDVVVWVVVEGSRLGERACACGAVRHVRAQDDVGQRVRTPLHFEVGPEGDVARVLCGVGVGERRRVLSCQEVLGVSGADLVVVAVVIAGASLEGEFLAFRGKVQAKVLASGQAGIAAPARASSAAGEGLVVDVVGTPDERHLRIAPEVVHHAAQRIAVFRAASDVRIAEPSGVHLFLHGQVQDGFFLAVIDAGDAGQVRLLVVGLQLLNHLHGQVLQAGGHVSAEELLAVHQYLGYVFPVDFHVAVIVHLGAGQLLYQLLQRGALGRSVGIRVELHGVFHHLHLWGFGHYDGFGQHDGIRLEHNVSHPLGRRNKLHGGI